MTAKRIVAGPDGAGQDLPASTHDTEHAGPSVASVANDALAAAARSSRRLRIVLGVNLSILVFMLAGAAYGLMVVTAPKGGPAQPNPIIPSTEMVWVRSIYGWGNTRDTHLMAPNSVAIGPDGVIWANSRNRYAVAFNPDGSFDRILMSKESTSAEATGSASPSMGGTSTTTPKSPKADKKKAAPAPAAASSAPDHVTAVFSLAVDNQNNLYIGDDAEGNVLKFAADGRLEQGWKVPGLSKLSASNSRVAVVGPGNLGVFAQGTGKPLFAFGSRGQGVRQFDLPVGVHIDDAGNVYVADTQNQRVRKFDPNGRLLWDAGTVPDRAAARKNATMTAPATGIFELPTGLTLDGNGHVVVVDAFKYQIIVLDGATGKKIAAYGDFGSEDGLFNNPSAIAYDAERDYFVVADTQNDRLQVVRLPGSTNTPAVVTALRQAADKPVWVLGMPFAVLPVAFATTSLMRRRRRKG